MSVVVFSREVGEGRIERMEAADERREQIRCTMAGALFGIAESLTHARPPHARAYPRVYETDVVQRVAEETGLDEKDAIKLLIEFSHDKTPLDKSGWTIFRGNYIKDREDIGCEPIQFVKFIPPEEPIQHLT